MSKIRQDFILDENYEPLCEDGDFVTGDADAQNVHLLLACTKASFKESPTACVGLVHWLKKQGATIQSMRREIMIQLETDGYKGSNFNVYEDSEFSVDYENKY